MKPFLGSRGLFSGGELLDLCSVQGGPILVVDGVVTGINGLIQWETGLISPLLIGAPFHSIYNDRLGAHLVV